MFYVPSLAVRRSVAPLLVLIALAGAVTESAATAPEATPETTPAQRQCHATDAVAILASPRSPTPGGRLRLLAVAEQPVDARLVVLDPAGNRLGATAEPGWDAGRHHGPVGSGVEPWQRRGFG